MIAAKNKTRIIENVSLTELQTTALQTPPTIVLHNKKYVISELNINNNLDALGLCGICMITVKLFDLDKEELLAGDLVKTPYDNIYNIIVSTMKKEEQLEFKINLHPEAPTIRDTIAIQTLNALINNRSSGLSTQEMVRTAYKIADLMMDAREK